MESTPPLPPPCIKILPKAGQEQGKGLEEQTYPPYIIESTSPKLLDTWM